MIISRLQLCFFSPLPVKSSEEDLRIYDSAMKLGAGKLERNEGVGEYDERGREKREMQCSREVA